MLSNHDSKRQELSKKGDNLGHSEIKSITADSHSGNFYSYSICVIMTCCKHCTL